MPIQTDWESKIETRDYAGKSYRVLNGTYYQIETDESIVRRIEIIRLGRMRVAFYYGNTETGECWDWMRRDKPLDVGTVGRSMGPVKIPLLIHNRRSMGGGGILTASIVKIRESSGAKNILYVHPKFHFGKD